MKLDDLPKFKIYVLLFFYLTIFPIQSQAIEYEWSLLPTWCKYTQAGGEGSVIQSVQGKVLISQLGKDTWVHLHHYCRALMHIYRSHGIGLSQQQREFHLGSAVGEISYVIKNAPVNSILRPELLTKRGSILLRLQKYPEAQSDLETSIKEKPDYWPAYGYLSDLYIEKGDQTKARIILQDGLKVSPNAKGLKIRMKRFQ